MRPIGPQRLADDIGEADVGDPQTTVVTEHQRRGSDVAMDQAVAMNDIECLAGLEADHQRLRWRQCAASVEVLAQAPSPEVLDDDVHRLAVVPDVGAPVVDLGDVGVLDRRALFCSHSERSFEALARAEIRMHDFDRDNTLLDQVERIEDGRVDTAAAARP